MAIEEKRMKIKGLMKVINEKTAYKEGSGCLRLLSKQFEQMSESAIVTLTMVLISARDRD